MSSSKRSIKEAQIIDAAEKVFSTLGFNNTRMESIANEIGISKGTIYFYFNSKENLFMAVTHRAFQTIIDLYYQCVENNKNVSGFHSVMAIMDAYLNFAEKNYYYFELLMNYMSLVRANSEGKSGLLRLSEAMQESLYFRKIQDIHNLPLNIVVKELQRGQEDGSILNKSNPVMIYLTAWAVVIGYTSLNVNNNKSGRSSIFQVPVADWKANILQLIRNILLDSNAQTTNNLALNSVSDDI